MTDIGRVRSGPMYMAQGASGMVFATHRLTAGAVGFVTAGLLVAAASAVQILAAKGSAPAELTIPLGVVLAVCAAIVLACTNVVVARSVVIEFSGKRQQTLKEGVRFAKDNIKTILLYPLSFLGLIVAAVLAMGLLTFVSAIPVVGNVLYGLALFPICVLLAITAVVLSMIFSVTAFVFAGHVAAEQSGVGQTVRDLIRLVRSRWASLIWAQLLATIVALFLGTLLFYVGVSGVLSSTSLWALVQLSRGFRGGDFADLPRMLSQISADSDAAAFGAVMVAFWLFVFALAVVSFIPTYMSTAGALTYLNAIAHKGSSNPSAAGETSPTVLQDIGGSAGGRRFPVPEQGIRVGRGGDCDVVVRSEFASGEHLLVTPAEEGRLSIQDLQSTNGTYVNGERVTAVEVGPGDEIRLGSDSNARFIVSA